MATILIYLGFILLNFYNNSIKKEKYLTSLYIIYIKCCTPSIDLTPQALPKQLARPRHPYGTRK